jgi:ATP-dependent DNA helicase RecQ
MPGIEVARRTLLDVFGFDRFRPGQETVIEALLEGRSSLAIFPTGGGKSLCYQLPALLLDGLTVVVSPLIALMKDQVDELTRKGVAAARLDSSLEPDQARKVHDDLRNGRLKLLYVAPERLAGERFVASLAGRNITLLAIDEAHCISEWGHNFRPEYLKLARLAKRLKVGRVLALTATATPDVARSIARAFAIDSGDVVQASFHRPNLELHAIPSRVEDRLDRFLDRMKHRLPGAAIVYVTLQKTAEDLARFLTENGLPAEAYHAGLNDEIRHAVQERFMASAGGIVVATIAFGMGIDKADIRTVLHYNLPKGPESYAQEIGRAGRDGLPARCELIACREDLTTLENFVYGDTPTRESVASLVEDVLGHGLEFDVSTYDLSGKHDVRPLVVSTLMTYLELEGIIEATGPFYAEYKFKSDRPIEQIIDRFDPARRVFLNEVFARSNRSRIWSTLDVDAASKELGEPRGRIVAALGYLEEKGEITVQATGSRQGYRLLKPPADLESLLELLFGRFVERESREITRLHAMLAFANDPGCLTTRLTAHFGEILAIDCGHCGSCLGLSHDPLPEPVRLSFSTEDRATVRSVLDEKHKALITRRQVARFLCGLASPATSRGKLTRDPRFGSLGDFPFSRVLKLVEAARS